MVQWLTNREVKLTRENHRLQARLVGVEPLNQLF